jgi:hypothetical protein
MRHHSFLLLCVTATLLSTVSSYAMTQGIDPASTEFGVTVQTRVNGGEFYLRANQPKKRAADVSRFVRENTFIRGTSIANSPSCPLLDANPDCHR